MTSPHADSGGRYGPVARAEQKGQNDGPGETAEDLYYERLQQWEENEAANDEPTPTPRRDYDEEFFTWYDVPHDGRRVP